MANIKATLHKSILKLLRPIAKILIRYGISHSEFSELAKRVFVDVAENENEFKISDRKQTTARIAILTGISRKDVSRIQKLSDSEENEPVSHNRASQVVNGWITDARFNDNNGNPLELTTNKEIISFNTLVKDYSGDVPVRAILDELMHTGAAEKTDSGKIKLCSKAYIPQSCDAEKLRILGNSGYDLLDTIAHNIPSSIESSRLQLTLAYNHLPESALLEFQEMSEKHAQKTLLLLNKWLSKQNMKPNENDDSPPQFRAGLGIYYFEEPANKTK